MYFILTLFIGFTFLNIIISFFEIILDIQSVIFQGWFLTYLIIGYFIMFLLKISSPLNPKNNKNLFLTIKKIELKLFFTDIYYAIWWPYYLFKKNNK